MAIARVSSGKISETVRYAELAPADAKKKTTTQQAVSGPADRCPPPQRNAVPISSAPERMYVPEIMTLRPSRSNSRLSRNAPRKLPSPIGTRYQPAWSSATLKNFDRTSAYVKNTALYRNACPTNSDRPSTV